MSIKRKVVDFLVDSFITNATRLRRWQMVEPSAKPVMINLGCGLDVAPGWINIDGGPHSFFAAWPRSVVGILHQFSEFRSTMTKQEYVDTVKGNVFVHHNLEYGIPLGDESVDYVFTAHFLEHLYKVVALRLIRESYRVLKTGGRMRIIVPDLEYVMTLYAKGDKEDFLRHFYVPDRQKEFGYHRYLYDFDMLKTYLLQAGFSRVERCAYRQGETPDIDKLENRPDESLYLEAVK